MLFPFTPVKLASLLLLFALGSGLTGCNTLVTRRDLYSPAKGSGPWTDLYNARHRQEGIFGISNSDHRGIAPGPQEGIFGISHP